MLRRFLTWLLRTKPEPEDIVQEKWNTTFSIFNRRRFTDEARADFEAFHRGGAFHLHLKKKNLFAWALDGPYRYRNLVAEMKISFAPENGHCSAGMMLRYMSSENYYYALVSNRGRFRFDVVINGNPVSLIPWIDIGLPDETADLTLRAIAHNSSFSFYVNDEWVAELDDETISAGHLAFCSQNYDEKDTAWCSLNAMRLESRPVEVDIWFYRWTRFIPAPPARRITLARRFNGQGQHAAALVQLRKAYRSEEPDVQGLFLLAETCLNLDMTDEALEQIEECLRRDPGHSQARLEKANILYLQNRFSDTKEYLSTIIHDYDDYSGAWNLLGNAEYALGNWSASAEAYQKAVRLEEEMPIFQLNAARAFDRSGKVDQAEIHYAEALRYFFRQDAYDELPPVFERMKKLAPKNPVFRTVRGKVLFSDGAFQEAEQLFLSLITEEQAESEVYFLEGLIKAREGKHAEAIGFFESSIELQPDFYLYWLKKGESEYYSGGDPSASLEKARSLNPDDGWVRNLAGLVSLEGGNLSAAKRELEEALRILPDEEEVRINLSEVLYRLEGIQPAVAVLDEKKAASRNQSGNLYAGEGRLDEALEEYRTAVRLDGEQPVYRENLAAALWESGLINEAEEHLARLLEERPSERAYELIGQVAYEKGQYSRATAAWKEAVDLNPESDHLKLLHARGLLHSGEIETARKIAEQLQSGPEREGAEVLLKRIREITHRRYVCDECGREWWVPNDVPHQKQVKLVGEPPVEMPAGKCTECGRVYCVGCASQHMKQNRFICPHCDTGLKLSDDGLKYLALRYVEQEREQ